MAARIVGRLLNSTTPTGLVTVRDDWLKAMQNILLIRIDERLGNNIITLKVAQELKKNFPGVQITYLACERYAGVMQGQPGIDRVLCFNKRWFYYSPWRLYSLIEKLQKERFHLAIDASHWHTFSFTSALLAKFSGAQIILGHSRGPWTYYYHLAAQVTPGLELKVKLELLSPLQINIQEEDLRPSHFSLRNVNRERVSPALGEFYFRTSQRGKGLVGLYPGARKGDRRWQLDGLIQLGRNFQKKGYQIVVLWGPGEESLARRLSHKLHLWHPPLMDVNELAEAIEKLDLFICPDTGPLHLAAALRTKVVGIFTRDDYHRWGYGHNPLYRGIYTGQKEMHQLVEEISAKGVELLNCR